jgi:3-hydroxybutyrate dehydrogenase
MAKPADIRAMVKTAVEQLGGVDILVNNAGIQHVAPVVDFPEERWDAVIAINLSAAFHAAKAALPHMTAKGWGRIINIASAHGLVASGEKAAYVTAKHGLVGLTKVVAIETANSGVTCNAICPGWVLTPLVRQQIEARAAAQGIPYQQAHDDLLREKQPMLQYTTPEKIGGLAVFLCGDAASTMTGAALSIDGGWTAQ